MDLSQGRLVILKLMSTFSLSSLASYITAPKYSSTSYTLKKQCADWPSLNWLTFSQSKIGFFWIIYKTNLFVYFNLGFFTTTSTFQFFNISFLSELWIAHSVPSSFLTSSWSGLPTAVFLFGEALSLQLTYYFRRYPLSKFQVGVYTTWLIEWPTTRARWFAWKPSVPLIGTLAIHESWRASLMRSYWITLRECALIAILTFSDWQ